MRLVIEILTDGDDEGPGTRSDAIILARDALAAFKRGKGSHERQYCVGAYRLTVNGADMVIGERSDVLVERDRSP